ncbi:MAG: TauD/TfdA family dioxygenase [Rhodospirillales bacterium]|nr:TauD/TfdA family dioxygenase [Rhodospirillales bacterium]
MTALDATPLSPALGIEVADIDLSKPLGGETVSALRSLWLEHGVMLFRGQFLDDPQLVDAARLFGEPVAPNTVSGPEAGRDPHVLLISNIRENGEPIGALPDGELQFHSDSAFLAEPLMATMLHGDRIPSRGGETLFASAAKAYETLSDDQKERLRGLEAVNAYDYYTQVKTAAYDRTTGPFAVHPVVRTHPETGRKVIYVNRLMTEEIVGKPAEESDAILADLFERLEDPGLRYTHVWRPGDVLIWDNRSVQHARNDFPAEEARLLRRVGLKGDRPY